MKVIKYRKLSNGRYKVTFDTNEMILYEDIILKYELLIKKEIDRDTIDKVIKDNTTYEVYYVGLNSIKSRFKSTYDLRELLLKKGYLLDDVNFAIEKLTKQGYLNDLSFAKSFINNQIITTSKGPNKIKSELASHKVDNDIINKEIIVFDADLQISRIEKLANRFLKSNRTRGGMVLKRKITTDLINYGYDIRLIDKVLSNFEFTNDKDIAKKEYEKLYRKYSRKLSGTELNNKVREAMYMKGLKYEED